MRTIRTLYRLFRLVTMIYAVIRALGSSRLLFVGLALWRMFRKSKVRQPIVADIAFVDGADPVLYKRTGWRTIIPRRVGERSE